LSNRKGRSSHNVINNRIEINWGSRACVTSILNTYCKLLILINKINAYFWMFYTYKQFICICHYKIPYKCIYILPGNPTKLCLILGLWMNYCESVHLQNKKEPIQVSVMWWHIVKYLYISLSNRNWVVLAIHIKKLKTCYQAKNTYISTVWH